MDIAGIVYDGRPGMDDNLAEVAARTNKARMSGNVHDAIVDADVFIGVSAPNVISGSDVARMRPGAVVFALANPDPEIDPMEAQAYAAVVATGRSDFPNQINNVLAFPGVFRGLLDARPARSPTRCCSRPPARYRAVVSPDQLNASFIVPSVFDEKVVPAVARAIVTTVHPEPLPGGAKVTL